MQFNEYPLLNTPNLMAVLLRAAGEGTPSVADCARRLAATLALAGEAPPVPPERILRRLDTLRRHLEIARLIAPVGADRFQLTERGRAALAAHPAGFATDDLMAYPEYAAEVRARARRPDGGVPQGRAFDAGFDAGLRRRSPAENPYPADSADHLAWENGWSEAGEAGSALRMRTRASLSARIRARTTRRRPSASGRSSGPGSPAVSPSQSARSPGAEDRRHPVVHRRDVGARRAGDGGEARQLHPARRAPAVVDRGDGEQRAVGRGDRPAGLAPPRRRSTRTSR